MLLAYLYFTLTVAPSTQLKKKMGKKKIKKETRMNGPMKSLCSPNIKLTIHFFLTIGKFPDFSQIAVKFPSFSRSSRWMATVHSLQKLVTGRGVNWLQQAEEDEMHSPIYQMSKIYSTLTLQDTDKWSSWITSALRWSWTAEKFSTNFDSASCMLEFQVSLWAYFSKVLAKWSPYIKYKSSVVH